MGIISDEIYSLILDSAIITMILTPLLMSLAAWLYPKLVPGPATTDAMDTAILPASAAEANEVIIAGYGRVGQTIAQGLKEAGVPYTVIEIDPEVVSKLRYNGIACIYGDASNSHVLARVGLKRAKALVITFPDSIAVMTTVQTALKINPRLKVVARAHRAKEVEQLKRLGIREIVSPEYEASLKFLEKTLSVSGWRKRDINKTLAKLRQAREIAQSNADKAGEFDE